MLYEYDVYTLYTATSAVTELIEVYTTTIDVMVVFRGVYIEHFASKLCPSPGDTMFNPGVVTGHLLLWYRESELLLWVVFTWFWRQVGGVHTRPHGQPARHQHDQLRQPYLRGAFCVFA